MGGLESRVLGVVVTYYPSPDKLLPLIRSLCNQVDELLLVDNTPNTDAHVNYVLDLVSIAIPAARLVRIGRNIGIAAAQNIGCLVALSESFDFILMTDQDSLPSEDMVGELVACHELLRSEGVRVGCVCPLYRDLTTRQFFRFQVEAPRRFFYQSASGDIAYPYVEIVTSISSGMLISCEALDKVGLMEERFFIDHVDTEWCHRARSRGYRVYGTSKAMLSHRLGDGEFAVWYFGWRSHSRYPATRLYYRFRNFILLCRLPHVPSRWCIRASLYWLGNFYAHAIFDRDRFVNVVSMLIGIRDGLYGRDGPKREMLCRCLSATLTSRS
jgi:rhamnosyltransferase